MDLSSREYLKEAILSALIEDVQSNKIVDAIKKKHEAVIDYNDGAEGDRYIEPVAYGLSTSGNPVVRAFQTDGPTKTGNDDWKLFRLDRITKWDTRNDTSFDEPPGYNPNGDRDMQTVYTVAKFGDEVPTSDYETSGIDTGDNTIPPQQTIDRRSNAGRNIAGISTADTNTERTPSWKEMSQVNDFGGNTYSQSNEPVKKGDEENTPVETDTDKPEYGQVAKNGPQYKEREEEPETDAIDALNFVDDEEEEEKNTQI